MITVRTIKDSRQKLRHYDEYQHDECGHLEHYLVNLSTFSFQI